MADDGSIAISLVVATVGRVDELDRMLASIAERTLKDVELIIVDQNPDDRVEPVLERWRPHLQYAHVRSARGLSRARNVGLQLTTGCIVGFPDDDCWYPESLLFEVKQWFDRNEDYDFLCCAVQDGNGREVAARWPGYSQEIDRDSVLRTCASASLFMRREALEDIEGFDEKMGLGAATPFQSGEDSDLALRCLNANGRGWFEKHLSVYHPCKGPGEVTAERAFDYGMGFGYLLRKHGYSPQTLVYHVTRALGGMIKSLLLAQPREARFYWQSARGRLKGYATPRTILPRHLQCL
jgi:glycosyltransferase involved in cell wall biosynthesis